MRELCSKIFYIFITLLFSAFTSLAQPCLGSGSGSTTPTKCFEIESILVDACDTCGNTCEGVFEMIRLRVGGSPLSVTNINVAPYVTGNVAWGTGSTTPFRGFCDITNVPANQSKINTINASIIAAGKCGRLIPINSTGTLPAGANVLIFMSTQFSPLTHSFANLTDTLYVLMQCSGNVSGHFSNSAASTRRLIMTYGSSCSDTAIYSPSSLVDQTGNTPSGDGATVNYTWSGTPTYVNYGCAIPVTPIVVNAGTTAPNYCSGGNVTLSGTVTGSSCYNWYPKNRNSGSFTDSTNLLTTFKISSNFSGSCTLYLKAFISCGNAIDSVIFNVNPTTDSVRITAFTDTVHCNKNTLTINSMGTGLPVVWTTNGKGTFNQTNTFSPVYTPSINDTSLIWFVISKTTSCAIVRDSVRVRFTPKPNASFWPTDTFVCINSGTINLNPIQTGGVFSGLYVTGNTFVTPNTPGIYSVKHIITNNGCKDSIVKNITVISKPDASFSLSDSIICLGNQSVTISTTQTGGIFYGASFSNNKFTPTTTGTYFISYVVSNSKCKDSVTKTVNVNQAPSANFTPSDTVLCQGDLPVTFTTVSSNGIYQGNHILNNKFYPDSAGIFIVKYVVDTLGCKDSSTQTIRVLTKPKAKFTYLPLLPLTNENVNFTYTGTVVNNYLWQFGDGFNSSDKNPSHIFTKEEKYPVVLIVSTTEGCLDTAMMEIEISAEEYLFVPNVFTPNDDSLNDKFVIVSKGFASYQINIYNCWGGQMFESLDSTKHWDGTTNNNPSAESVYVYIVTVTRHNGEKKSLHGTVTLLR